ncbi:patatin-like phospholipase family protein [Sphingomonas sp.]|jgi:NTE family protein|uniref:patatin-like phospholipase family protein n=1 Tax=Sphingomonas sp. TaxID=28214 RepID=UPI002D801957|nr:patatin-like phospholipase family protein [Sphingomonas sp.]HEU0043014.1 patatin-like phospholipase family protein [Sphingomonas sp.]
MIDRDYLFALVLGGGSALGAYQGGVYEAIHAAGLLPDWVSGGSAGAVNGALIAGNAPEDRVGRLRAFWRPGLTQAADDGPIDEWRRTLAVPLAMLTGRTGMFSPRSLTMPAWPFGNTEPPSLFDTTPLGEAMARMVDFERLNASSPRYCATAVDVESGDDVVFDTAYMTLTPDHIRASSALLPAFPPVELEGRLLGDAGIAANLPIDAVLEHAGVGKLLIVAVDLLPLKANRPKTLTEVASRLQDLNFATQSRRAILAWHRLLAERLRGPDAGQVPAITFVHLIYGDQSREVVGKAFDFSPATIRDRWDCGGRDAGEMLAMLGDGRIPIAEAPGLHLHRLAIGEPGL